MLCQQCHEREATIHLTQIVGDKLTKRDLCEVCGREFVDAAKFGKSIGLEALVAGRPEQTRYDLLAKDSRYAKGAYLFVQEGLAKAQKMFWTPSGPRHVSGTELLEGLRELAIETYGKQAKATLNSWGVFKCEDFGEIVFKLIEAGMLAKQETDTKKDFQGGYDFDAAFPS